MNVLHNPLLSLDIVLDFLFFGLGLTMPLTKTTPRKNKCPMCPFKTVDFEALKTHISECGLKQIEKYSIVRNVVIAQIRTLTW